MKKLLILTVLVLAACGGKASPPSDIRSPYYYIHNWWYLMQEEVIPTSGKIIQVKKYDENLEAVFISVRFKSLPKRETIEFIIKNGMVENAVQMTHHNAGAPGYSQPGP